MSVVGFIRRMIAAGCDIQTALIAAEAFEAEIAPFVPDLTPRQARNRRYYEKRLKASEIKTLKTDSDVSDASPPSPKNRTESSSTSENLQTPTLQKDIPLKGYIQKGSRRPSRRCPADWVPKPSLMAFAEAEGFSSGELERELSRFRDYEFGVAHSDWDATFRNWIRKAKDRKPKHGLDDPKYLARQANLERSAAAARVVAEAYRSARGNGREPDPLWEDWSPPRGVAVAS